jgi:demethylmenaquinone methyltransferase / 2-methoxy-6-polyprenyl-1,4-benzoquinol methylase
VLILEITKPPSQVGKFFFRLYFARIYPALTLLVTGSYDARNMMRYYWETMDASVPPPVVLDGLRSAGFVDVKRTRMLGLFSEYSAVKS